MKISQKNKKNFDKYLNVFYILQNVKHVFCTDIFCVGRWNGFLSNLQNFDGMLMTADKKTDFSIPAKLYRIGELVRHTPFSRQTIHNYTTMGLIREIQWTDGGHRLYDESVFERLSKIVELRKSRTLAQIKRILLDEDADKPPLPN